ncbi:membrane protein [Pseudomonas saudiphocaensis]|uniref:Intracellular septation protein A n=1 Tax=Pseudomonas saudiphocaensis TaxID=1499686 RepID=A0A078LT30_9PSED|nr:membrane protein [Pseudomonas saudiphocaensis]CDZ95573.1 intracellular septation protein A [Pseudomonas saudiphocaensis]
MPTASATGKATVHRLIGLGLLLVGLTYPFIVYLGMGHLSPRLFALMLGTLWLARALSPRQTPLSRTLSIAALSFCLVLALADSSILLLGYPVLINLALLALFAGSLCSGMPIIERLARLQEPELPPAAVRYTRKVTWVWAGFFSVNAAIATGLALWAPLTWWTLYTGLIAYLLMGLLFAGEWLVRQRVRKAT